MHYYPHHIGDFIKDTSNLTDAQCMAYLRMCWRYYLDEKPITDELEDIAFAVRSDEKTVRLLLKHYFVEQDDGWHHTRIDKEIAAFKAKSEKAKASANARWKQDKSKQSDSERNANASQSDANQEPITNIPSKDSENTSTEVAQIKSPTLSGSICKKLNSIGITGLNPSHPKFLKMLEAGATEQEFVDAADTIAEKSKRTFTYLLAKVEGIRQDAANANVVTGDFGDKAKHWCMTSSGIEKKAEELGIVREEGEQFPYFKKRVYKAAGLSNEDYAKAKADFEGKRA